MIQAFMALIRKAAIRLTGKPDVVGVEIERALRKSRKSNVVYASHSPLNLQLCGLRPKSDLWPI